MQIQKLTVDAAMDSLQTRAEGLSTVEARRRLAEYGPNRVERAEGRGWATKLVAEFVHFLALVLWVAAGLAFFAAWEQPAEGMGVLGLAIVGVIVINGLFAFWQQQRAEQAITELRKLLPHQVKVVRDGRVVAADAAELVPGDILVLRTGDGVPADCRLTEAVGVRVDTSTITGESLAQARSVAPTDELHLVHASNILLASTSLVSGEARAVVYATGQHTEFGHIAHLTQTSGPGATPLQREIRRLSRLMASLATGLGILFFLLGQAVGLSFWESLLFGIGIIVANVPEGLLPTVTLALAMASQRMARRNALVRHLPSVETLGSATVICTDKTGTLTLNRMVVRRLFVDGRFQGPLDLASGGGFSRAADRMLEVAAHCQNVERVERHGRASLVGDPLDIALLELAQDAAGLSVAHPRCGEVPFDTDRKRLSTLHETPQGRVLYSKGALETVLPLCTQIELAGWNEALTPETKQTLLEAQNAMADEGLRVLAMAYRPVSSVQGDPATWEQDLILCGLVGLEDPPRPEVPEAITRCRTAGIRVVMVTGDHPHTALAIARQVGLVQAGESATVITGEQLRRASDIQLQLALDAPQILFARVGADQKMRIVRALRRKGAVVATTGDGVNDAPALKAADIGIAMGRSGTDVAREAADMVLLDDNFASIVAAVEEGRAVFANIRKFLTYILSSNVPEIVPYLAFALFRIPLPLTVIQILAVDLGTDMVPALALGAQLPERGIMQKPPRTTKERLVTPGLLLRAYLFLGPMEALAAISAFFFILQGTDWSYGQQLASTEPLYRQATAACLAAIILMQVVNVWVCRSDRLPAWRSLRVGVAWILAGVLVEIALLVMIVYTPVGQWAFGTAPLPPTLWLFVLPFGAAMLVLDELRKWLLRRHHPRPSRPYCAT